MVAVLADTPQGMLAPSRPAPAPAARHLTLVRIPASLGERDQAGTRQLPVGVSRGEYWRRRVLAALIVVTVAVGVWVALQSAFGASASGQVPAHARVWVVQPGDTLWSIAMASGARGDIRPYVDKLSAEVKGQPLVVGERITLPRVA